MTTSPSTTARPLADPRLLRADRGPLLVVRPGQIPYREAWALQQRLVAAHGDGDGRDVLLLLEHPPVYTLGRRADPTHVTMDAQTLASRGIEVVPVDRGGDVTYHGPGQLVGYPIWRLAKVHAVVDHVRALETILIDTLASYGVDGQRLDGLTGVWVDPGVGPPEKVAAIGVRVATGGVTSHGFALNVCPDLTDFAGIVPCGIADKGVCSLASLGVDATVDDVAERLTTVAAGVLDTSVTHGTLDHLPTPDAEPRS